MLKTRPSLFLNVVLVGGVGLLTLFPLAASAQKKTTIVHHPKADSTSKMVVAGHYDRSGFHNWLFGKHYRDEWSTPVQVPVLHLDTMNGEGLTPYKGRGGQGRSLRLRDEDDREYVLRTLDRSNSEKMDPIYRGTFLEDWVDDQVSTDHPYAAVTIPPMAAAAKIYHTDPRIGYVPVQDGLDSFRHSYGNYVYLLEQRPAGNWETDPGLGNADKIVSTDNMLASLEANSTNKVDQLMFVRCRLFDMFIGDWGRYEENWRWSVNHTSTGIIYKPIPRDRDQAYSKFDGLATKGVLRLADARHLQSFDDDIHKIKEYNYAPRHLDRRCTNEVTLEQWRAIAKDLQASLTDNVIEEAVHRMPPEVFPISGPTIIADLKSRRAHLVEWAEQYYYFLARHVDVPGSAVNEYFDVRRVNDNETKVDIYPIDANGVVSATASYNRIFKTNETQDIRLYGIDGNDKYMVSGKVNAGLYVRIIGGPDKDVIVDNSDVSGARHKTVVYDDWDNTITRSHETNLKLSNDTGIHIYDYNEFEFHKRGIKPLVYYNNPDRIFASIGYGFAHHKWRKTPYSFDQSIYLRYSLSQNALSLLYEGRFYQVIRNWGLTLTGNYDAVRWTNFFGLGNDTKRYNNDLKFYRLRTRELLATANLHRTIGHSTIELSASVQGTEIINDHGKYVSEVYLPNQLYYYEHHGYATGRVGYTYLDVNSFTAPTKGIMFYAGAAYTQNLNLSDKNFETYNGIFHFFLPLIGKFGISSRTAVSHVSGSPEFYQYASVGGPLNMRGYVLDRFWGNTAFYNSNELRYITNMRTHLLNGKIGLLVLYDWGRVWLNGENSNTLHHAVGGGLLLAPFDKFTVTGTYARSPEGGLFQIRLIKLLDQDYYRQSKSFTPKSQ